MSLSSNGPELGLPHLVLGWVVAGGAAIGWFMLLGELVSMWRARVWPTASGVVVSLRERTYWDEGNRRVLYTPVLRYLLPDGREVQGHPDQWSTNSMLSVGAQAMIRYHPRRPENIYVVGFGKTGAASAIFAIMVIPVGIYLDLALWLDIL
ncbi:MAG TPA: DUF3592 domain-containing protein [Actinomadura sp.]|jgi:hypothetical protein|nr:DUF3592 domain-containing protein [Actinomadura sp.]